jgi:hypothetical protein
MERNQLHLTMTYVTILLTSGKRRKWITAPFYYVFSEGKQKRKGAAFSQSRNSVAERRRRG